MNGFLKFIHQPIRKEIDNVSYERFTPRLHCVANLT